MTMVLQVMVALSRVPKRWGSSSSTRTFSLPSMYSLSRAFSAKLFVGGLSYHTDEEMLRKAFAEHGDVVDVRIIMDRETGRSRGFGFVTFGSEADAETAKTKMASHLLDGRFIRVDMASSRPPVPGPFGNPPSSSSSAFSFAGRGGTRPPVVEDWGPLPSYSAQASQTTTTQVSHTTSVTQASQTTTSTGIINNSYQGGAAPLNGFLQPLTSSSSPFHDANRGESSTFGGDSRDQQSSSIGSNVALQSNPSPQSIAGGIAAIDNQNACGSAVSVAASQTTTSHIGIGPSDVPTTQGANSSSPAMSSSVTAGIPKPKRSVASEGSSKKDVFANWQSKVTEVTWESKLTEEAIPPPKGPVYDFGLGSLPDSPPPLDEGANPHGGFNPSVCLDGLGEAEPVRLPYSIFTARTLPPLDLPWLTPEADNWSEIGKPPRRIEDSPYSPFSPDLKDDPEFWWDPYDFDAEGKAIKEAFPDVQPIIKDEPIELKLFKDRKPVEPAAAVAANTAS